MSRASELIRLLHLAYDWVDPNESRSHINNQVHCLRVATLAKRYSPWDNDAVFSALVHDLGRPLSDPFHGEVMAEIVRDMVAPKWYHILRTHGLYQSWLIHGEPMGISFAAEWHRDAVALSAWEETSFRKPWTHVTMPLHEAEALIELVCAGRL